MNILLLALGAFGGFLSGLLGIGGAVVMIPLLLSVPPLFGLGELSMHAVSGLSIAQVFFSSIAGLVMHGKSRSVDKRALLLIGIAMAASSLTGAYLSALAPSRLLLIVFGLVALAAAGLMALKPPADSANGETVPKVAPLPSVCIGLLVGLLSGLVGAGGGFILIPLMIYALRLPTRTAIGTSLGIVFLGSISGLVGKAAAGQIEWGLAAFFVLGAVPLALVGARLSSKLSPLALRILLGIVVLLSCAQIWWRILSGA
jgi:Predicted permeases